MGATSECVAWREISKPVVEEAATRPTSANFCKDDPGVETSAANDYISNKTQDGESSEKEDSGSQKDGGEPGPAMYPRKYV